MRKVILFILIVLLDFISMSKSGYNIEVINNNITHTEYKETEKDTILEYFEIYKDKCDLYLSHFENTPLSGEILANCAYETYIETNIIIPLELSLAQAQIESSLGTTGRSPSTNTYNVGEWKDKTTLKFKTTKEGVKAYYDLMAKRYLKNKTVDELLKNFVDIDGYRYAGPKYEEIITKQYNYIKRKLKNS